MECSVCLGAAACLQPCSHDPMQCSVCLSTVVGAAACLQPCSHEFHKPCIDRWIDTFSGKRHPTCPICRTPINLVSHENTNTIIAAPASGPPPLTIVSYALDNVCRTAALDLYGYVTSDEEADEYDSANEYGYSREDYYGCRSSDDEPVDEVDFDIDTNDVISNYY